MRLRTIGFICAMMGAAAVSFADDPALPDGYAPLDWIESTGGQYIDTGVNAGANTTIDMSFGHCVYIEESTLFGKDVWDPQGWLFIMQAGHFRFFGTQGSNAALWNLIGKDLTEQRALGGELSGYTLFLTPNRARIGRRGLTVIVK